MTATDAPTAPVKEKFGPEWKAKMAKARAVALAKKKASTPKRVFRGDTTDVPAIDPKDAEIKRLNALLAQASAPKTTDVAALPTHESYFEFRRNPKVPMEQIRSFDDPRWDEFRDGTKWAHPCHGSFVVERLVRDAAGAVVQRVIETHNTGLWGPSREAMGRFERTHKHYIENGYPVKA